MKKALIFFFGLFLITLGAGVAASFFLAGFDVAAFITADTLLLLLTVTIFRMQARTLSSSNPHQFVRAVMGGMILKMFVFIGALIIYVLAMDGKYAVSTIAGCLLMYLLYLIAEVRMILNMNKQ